MSLLSRYILRQIWKPALLASVLISFIMVASAIREQVQELGKDSPLAQVTLIDLSWISVYALPTLVGFIFPVTFLLGIMLTFGQMARYNETTAMKAAGISLKRAALPVLGAGIVLSLACFIAQDRGQPWAYNRMMQLVRSDLPMRVTIDMLPKGVMHEYAGWRVYIGSSDERGVLHDIVVLTPQADGRPTAFYAESAAVSKEDGIVTLTMRKGYYIPPEDKGHVFRVAFDILTKTVPALSRLDEGATRKGMTLAGLMEEEKRNTEAFLKGKTVKMSRELYQQRNEIAKRLSFPLMCLVVGLMAAPLGARSKKSGRSFTFASSFAIILVYYTLRKAVEPSDLVPLYEAVLLAQIPNLLLLATGTILLGRVDRV